MSMEYTAYGFIEKNIPPSELAMLLSCSIQVSAGKYSIHFRENREYVLRYEGNLDASDPWLADAWDEDKDSLISISKKISAVLEKANIKHSFEVSAADTDEVIRSTYYK